MLCRGSANRFPNTWKGPGWHAKYPHRHWHTFVQDTNYHFDVNVDALEEALDRFSQFFVCPLISKDAVEREVKAVNSECADVMGV